MPKMPSRCFKRKWDVWWKNLRLEIAPKTLPGAPFQGTNEVKSHTRAVNGWATASTRPGAPTGRRKARADRDCRAADQGGEVLTPGDHGVTGSVGEQVAVGTWARPQGGWRFLHQPSQGRRWMKERRPPYSRIPPGRLVADTLFRARDSRNYVFCSCWQGKNCTQALTVQAPTAAHKDRAGKPTHNRYIQKDITM
jgi:hypothetical protein